MDVSALQTVDLSVRRLWCLSQPLPHFARGLVTSLRSIGIPALIQGFLPPGRHLARVRDVRKRFVDQFPESVSRSPIFKQWVELRSALRSQGCFLYQWLNGSFITDKQNPSDIDIVTFFDGVAFEGLPEWRQNLVGHLCSGRCVHHSLPFSRVDSNFVAVFQRDIQST